MTPALFEALERLRRALAGEPTNPPPQPDPDHLERETFRQVWIARQREIDDV